MFSSFAYQGKTEGAFFCRHQFPWQQWCHLYVVCQSQLLKCINLLAEKTNISLHTIIIMFKNIMHRCVELSLFRNSCLLNHSAGSIFQEYPLNGNSAKIHTWRYLFTQKTILIELQWPFFLSFDMGYCTITSIYAATLLPPIIYYIAWSADGLIYPLILVIISIMVFSSEKKLWQAHQMIMYGI